MAARGRQDPAGPQLLWAAASNAGTAPSVNAAANGRLFPQIVLPHPGSQTAMTGANPQPQPERRAGDVLQQLPCSEQTTTDPLDNRQISSLDGHRMNDGRIRGIVHHSQLLGRKVPEERHLRDLGRGGDICARRLLVAALGKQCRSLPLQTRPAGPVSGRDRFSVATEAAVLGAISCVPRIVAPPVYLIGAFMRGLPGEQIDR
jgi:hypothetical protein